jgi:four helix bundle protein
MALTPENRNKTIKAFQDLRAYQNLYKAMILVLTKIVPKLPNEEKYDLANQMRRACKAGPALIAEGFAKRYQKRNWQKYIDDAIGESNEMINNLSVCIDVYSRYTNKDLCQEVIEIYDTASRQLYKLRMSWRNFHENR